MAGMGNRTVIVDNNTWNNTHIATVGRVDILGTSHLYRHWLVAKIKRIPLFVAWMWITC